jgi:hypothetical protein
MSGEPFHGETWCLKLIAEASPPLSICNVLCGKDGYGGPWDVAAGMVLVEVSEASYRVRTYEHKLRRVSQDEMITMALLYSHCKCSYRIRGAIGSNMTILLWQEAGGVVKCVSGKPFKLRLGKGKSRAFTPWPFLQSDPSGPGQSQSISPTHTVCARPRRRAQQLKGHFVCLLTLLAD